MVRLNVKFQKVAFPALYFRPLKRWYQELRLPGRVCSENIIRVPLGEEVGGRRDNIMKSAGETESKEMVIKPRKSAMVATLPCRPVMRVEWVRGGHKV